MGSTTDYAAEYLGIPNSHGGPINGSIVKSFSLDCPQKGIPSLNADGEFVEFYLGAGASVIVGLEGTLSAKIERKSDTENIYELTFLMEGSATVDLMAGVEAGAKGYMKASGMAKVGIPTVYKFTSEYDAIKGMAIAIRIILMLGTTPLIEAVAPLGTGWLVTAILRERTIDDIAFLVEKMIEVGVEVSRGGEIGAEISALSSGDGGGGDPMYSALGGSIGLTYEDGVFIKLRKEGPEVSLSLGFKIQVGLNGSATLLGLGPTGDIKGALTTQLSVQKLSSKTFTADGLKLLLREQSQNAMLGKAKKGISNTSLDISAELAVSAQGSLNYLLSGTQDISGSIKVTLQLLDIIRATTSMFDSGQTWSASLIHLGNVLKLDLGAKSQSVQGLTFSQNIKICGVGLSMKIGRRSGHNNSNYPKSLSVTASSLLAGYDVQTEVKNWFEGIFPPA